MTFEQSLEWLNSTSVFGIKLGLENIRRLLEALGNPQTGYSIFHVAGTNGKGSVCSMLDGLLRVSGFQTGLYTSPHLIDFRERIRVDGVKISPAAVAVGLTRMRESTAGWDHQPTYFEIATALALDHFAAEGCQAVVLETGLGGRLDATNAVTPRVSILTPIARDHCQWLGDSLEQIAWEKAGIIKAGVPVVSAAQDPAVAGVLESCAAPLGAKLRWIVEPLETVPLGLYGQHQRANAALALEALDAAGITPPGDGVRKALAEVRWPGRFHRVGEALVLDGAHNPHAARELVRTWRDCFGNRRATVIFGAMGDKDYPRMIEELCAIAEEFLFVPVQNPRAAGVGALEAACGIPFRPFASLPEALAAASGLTLVTGSLFLVGEAMAHLGMDP